jgi:CRP/FNR family transcriptional activator FtrB
VRPVSTFILAATIKNAPYLMSARTLEKSRIVLIPSQDVRAVFDVDGNFARAIVTELAQCYRSVIKAQKDLKLRTSLERLANYLLRNKSAPVGLPRSTWISKSAGWLRCWA